MGGGDDDDAAFWEAAAFHVDLDGDGGADGGVTSLSELRRALREPSSQITRATRCWAEGLDGWLPLGKLLLEIYGPRSDRAPLESTTTDLSIG